MAIDLKMESAISRLLFLSRLEKCCFDSKSTRFCRRSQCSLIGNTMDIQKSCKIYIQSAMWTFLRTFKGTLLLNHDFIPLKIWSSCPFPINSSLHTRTDLDMHKKSPLKSLQSPFFISEMQKWQQFSNFNVKIANRNAYNYETKCFKWTSDGFFRVRGNSGTVFVFFNTLLPITETGRDAITQQFTKNEIANGTSAFSVHPNSLFTQIVYKIAKNCWIKTVKVN